MGLYRPWIPPTRVWRKIACANRLSAFIPVVLVFSLLAQDCWSQTLEVPGRTSSREFCEFDIAVVDDGENVELEYECWGDISIHFKKDVMPLGALNEMEVYPGVKIFTDLGDGMAIIHVSQARQMNVVNSTISGFKKGIMAPIVVEAKSTVWIDESEVTGNVGKVAGALLCKEDSSVKLDKVRFDKNKGGKSGAIHADGAKSLVLMTNVTFLQNTGDEMAADMLLENGARAYGNNIKFCGLERGSHRSQLLDIQSVFLKNSPNPDKQNRALWMETNEAQSGSIYVSEGCELGLSSSEISWYVSLSGTVHGEQGSKIELEMVKICDNFGFNGAAVYADGAEVKMNKCDIMRNLGKIGGGITALGDTELTVSNSTFMGNHGTLGGAIYTGHSLHERCIDPKKEATEGAFLIENTTFAENVAQVDGGGIFAMCHNIKVVNSTFHVCTASENGGAIYMESLETATVTGNTFHGSSSHKGGGIYAQQVQNLDMQKSVFHGNSASQGAGVCGVDSKRIDVTQTTFQGNSANSHGGGLYLDSCGSFVSLNATVTNNTAQDSGGGFALLDTAKVDLTGVILDANHAEKKGGGVFGTFIKFLIAESTIVKENTAAIGAGLHVENNDTNSNPQMGLLAQGWVPMEWEETVSSKLLEEEYYSGDGVPAGWTENSSGKSSKEGASIFLSNSKFINNNATEKGGAANVFHAEKVEVWQCNFQGNHGGTFGGSLHLKSIRNTTIEKVSAKANWAGIAGGFALIVGVEDTQIMDSTIVDNIGDGGGGGVSLIGFPPEVNCNVNISNVLFERNRGTEGEAGAAIIYKCDNVQFSDTTFYSNVANGGGGAVVVSRVNSTLFQGSIFKGNEAGGGSGGAIYSSNFQGVGFSAIDCEFTSNSATGNGGSICLAGEMPTVDLHKSTFQDSSAKGYGGSIFVDRTTSVDLSDAVLIGSDSKKNGGGVVVESAQKVDVSRMKFTRCTSVGDGGGALFQDVAVVDGTDAVFSDCVSSTGKGGAMFLNPARHNAGSQLTLSACVAKHNKAQTSGGAFYVNKISDVSLAGCELTRNRVQTGRGGGLMVSGADTVNARSMTATGNVVGSSGGALSLIHVTSAVVSGAFHRNVATKKVGGAIHGDYLNVLDISSTTFDANRAHLSGGAVYLENGESVHGTNVAFYRNEASSQYGGAMNLKAIQTVSFIASHFGHNGAQSGGAVRCHELPPQLMDITFKDVNFTSNAADKVGGALLVEGGIGERYTKRRRLNFFEGDEADTHVVLALENTIFHGNSAKTGGAIVAKEGKVSIVDSIFSQNSAKSDGGAFSCGSGVSFNITDVDFEGNRAWRGSSLQASCGCQVEVSDSSFTRNVAKGYQEGAILDCNNNVVLSNGTIYLDNPSGDRPWWHYLFLAVLAVFVCIAIFWLVCFLRVCFKKTLRKVKGEKVYHDYAAIGSVDPEAPNWDAIGHGQPGIQPSASTSIDSSVGSALPAKPLPNQTTPLDNRTFSAGRTTEDGMLVIDENSDPEPLPNRALPKKLDPIESMKKAWSFQPQSRKESPRSVDVEHEPIELEPEDEHPPLTDDQNKDSNLQASSGALQGPSGAEDEIRESQFGSSTEI